MKVILKDLSKHFGNVKAVNNLNLEINDGEFIALLGPSGCGKTTTLLTVAGLYKPTRGYIYFNDRIVNEVSPKDRKIGMVFQSYALYPHMTVFDNITFPLKLKKTPREDRKRKALDVARLVHIEGLLNRKPAQLSGGQQQRVALCRALIKEPEILLLDEPLSNLDAKLRAAMRSELKRLQKDLSITTIFVTHDQVEAMTMADRVAVMNEGVLQQFSNPDELYNYPKSLFVAGFIGSPSINLIDVSLARSNGKFFLKGKGVQIELPREISSRVESNSLSPQLVFGIRPEHITVNQKKEGIKAEVYVVEPLGRENLVTIKTSDISLKVLTSPTLKIGPEEKVWIDFNLDKIMLFDKETGRSLLLR
ncbi:MAG: sugar ABC transporter ATP-binding protein [Thermotoga sp.]|nr:MAG: sugar ABC transporter ATP-binding protein [Thermotoga sp.]